jgi:hypothetical protein
MTIPLTRVPRNAHFRAIVGAVLVSVCGLVGVASLVCFALVHVNRAMGGNRDFVVYWATGTQLVQHRNPYDPAALPVIEHDAGLPHQYSVGYMRNPPWSLPLAWPLGLVSLGAAAVMASLVLTAAFVASVRIMLGVYGCRDRMVQWLAYGFAPALICLIWGQTSLLVLLGLALFLRFHATRPFLAGASLWLCTLKPHLLLPFGLVLLAWMAMTRSYRILAGTTAAFALSVLVTLRLDPQAWSQYKEMLGYSGVERDPIPSLSVLLRTHLTPHFMAMQFVLAAVACLWAVVYFWNRRREWNWSREANLLLLVSLAAAPYAYLNDHVVALPAVLFAACGTSSRGHLATVGAASAVLEIAFFANRWSPAPFYWATVVAGPLWICWYLLVRRRPAPSETPAALATAGN